MVRKALVTGAFVDPRFVGHVAVKGFSPSLTRHPVINGDGWLRCLPKAAVA